MPPITLRGQNFFLRALEPDDLDFLYDIENDENVWHVSQTTAPFSKYVLKQYLENAQQDIFEAKQLRLAVSDNSGKTVGLIDLFDFDPMNKRAGIGILINKIDQNNGAASEALGLLINYSFTRLQLHQLFANIDPQNEASVRLFTKFGFEKKGSKKDWNLTAGKYADEDFYQLINY